MTPCRVHRPAAQTGQIAAVVAIALVVDSDEFAWSGSAIRAADGTAGANAIELATREEDKEPPHDLLFVLIGATAGSLQVICMQPSFAFAAARRR